MKKNKLYLIVIGLLICLALIVSIAKIAVSAEDEIPSSVDTGVVETENTEDIPVEDLKAVLIILAESETKSEALDRVMQLNPNASAGDALALIDTFEEMSLFWDCRECVLLDLGEGLDYGIEAEWLEWYMDTYFSELPESCESFVTDNTLTEAPALTTEQVLDWIFENYEEITVILAVIAAALLIIERLTKVIKSIVTCNNNAVDIAVESKETTQAALDEVKSLKETVATYKEEFANLLAEVRQSDVEKKKYAEALSNNESFLKTAKLANMEFANELAELLVLANIPNSKKEELYARHRAAVAAIDTADNKNAEVKEDVREEA